MKAEYERGRADGLAEAVKVAEEHVTILGGKFGQINYAKYVEAKAIAESIRALSTSPDHVLVPREPTEAMLEAGAEVLDRLSLLGFREQAETAYRAMIAEVK